MGFTASPPMPEFSVNSTSIQACSVQTWGHHSKGWQIDDEDSIKYPDTTNPSTKQIDCQGTGKVLHSIKEKGMWRSRTTQTIEEVSAAPDLQPFFPDTEKWSPNPNTMTLRRITPLQNPVRQNPPKSKKMALVILILSSNMSVHDRTWSILTTFLPRSKGRTERFDKYFLTASRNCQDHATPIEIVKRSPVGKKIDLYPHVNARMHTSASGQSGCALEHKGLRGTCITNCSLPLSSSYRLEDRADTAWGPRFRTICWAHVSIAQLTSRCLWQCDFQQIQCRHNARALCSLCSPNSDAPCCQSFCCSAPNFLESSTCYGPYCPRWWTELSVQIGLLPILTWLCDHSKLADQQTVGPCVWTTEHTERCEHPCCPSTYELFHDASCM